MRSPYEILGVERGVSKGELDKAFRKLVVRYHPDKFQDPKQKSDAESKLKEVNEAYQKIKSGEADSPFGGEGGFSHEDVNMNDIFNSFFGGGFHGNVTKRVRTQVNVSLDQTFKAVSKTVKVQLGREERQLTFTIPVGVVSGSTFLLHKEKGYEVLVTVNVTDSGSRAVRVGQDYYVLGLYDKASGYVDVEHPLSGSLRFQSTGEWGETRKFKGLGFSGSRQGDTYVITYLNSGPGLTLLQDYLKLKSGGNEQDRGQGGFWGGQGFNFEF